MQTFTGVGTAFIMVVLGWHNLSNSEAVDHFQSETVDAMLLCKLLFLIPD
jgi:hypothetical protein